MAAPLRSLVAIPLAASALVQLACTHVPTRPEEARAEKPAAAERIFLTGSRIPQRVDARTGGLVTTSPLRIYSRDELFNTGRQADLRSALRVLDPSISP